MGKKPHHNVKRQMTNWEKNISNSYRQRAVFLIYTEPLEFNKKRPKTQDK